jgi:hypothetical protein
MNVTPGSHSKMYLLFAPTAISLLVILAMSLHSEFAATANL